MVSITLLVHSPHMVFWFTSRLWLTPLLWPFFDWLTYAFWKPSLSWFTLLLWYLLTSMVRPCTIVYVVSMAHSSALVLTSFTGSLCWYGTHPNIGSLLVRGTLRVYGLLSQNGIHHSSGSLWFFGTHPIAGSLLEHGIHFCHGSLVVPGTHWVAGSLALYGVL